MSEDIDKELEQYEAKLEEDRVAKEKARKVQYLADLKARESLRLEHEAVATVKASRFVQGQPTIAVVRTPKTEEYKRYKTLVHRAVSNDKKNSDAAKEASEQLARSCWIYPITDEARSAMLEVFPGLLTPLASAAAALAEGRVEEEGKG